MSVRDRQKITIGGRIKVGNDKNYLPLGAFSAPSPFVSSSLVVPHLRVISDSWEPTYGEMLNIKNFVSRTSL